MDIKQKLQKLLELSKKGSEGEKQNAESLLLKLMDKHNVTLEELDEERREERYYRYTTTHNRTIIAHVIGSVLDHFEFSYNKVYKYFIAETTVYEDIRIKELIDFHKKNFNKEKNQMLKDLISAYVHKHNLFSSQEDEKPKAPRERTLKELEAIQRALRLQRNLSDRTPILKIAN